MQAYLRLLKYLKPYLRDLVIAGGCMLGAATLTAVLAYLVRPALDEIFLEKKSHMLLGIPLIVCLVYVLKGTCDFGQYYLMSRTGQSIVRDLREQIFTKYAELSLSFFERHTTGELVSRMNNDVAMAENALTRAVTGIIRDAFTVVGLVFIVFHQDCVLATIAMVTFPLAVYPLLHFGRRFRRYSRRMLMSLEEITVRLNETISSIRIIKAFSMEDYERVRFNEVNDRLFNVFMRRFKVRALSSPVMETLGGLGVSCVVCYGGYRVINGTSTPGAFFSFIAALLMLYEPLKRISEVNITIQEGAVAAKRIIALLDTEPDVKDPPSPRALELVKEGITFDGVGFSYESTPVLENVSLRVNVGHSVAIVGESGAGKSTLMDLLPRFYDVTSGRILIDGVDIREFSQKFLRENIGIVTQQTILFDDTVRNNIAYGRPDISMESVIAAARAAHAHDFIEALPQKYDTLLGENGLRISGGERQRIAVARALLKNAPILILDEATSDLDVESERTVQDALEELMKGRTTLIVAHRLSTIRNVDYIYVLINGKVAEQGTHDELLAVHGHFARLISMSQPSQPPDRYLADHSLTWPE